MKANTMMRKTLLAAALLSALSYSAVAADYYIVMSVKGKTANVRDIRVVLGQVAPPPARVGVSYAFDFKPGLQVTGDPGYTGYGVKWALVAGSVPAGLALNADTGVLSGTPSGAATSTFTLSATYKTKSVAQSYSIAVTDIQVALAKATLPAAKAGNAYSYDFKSGLQVTGDPDYAGSGVTWAVALGTVPAGLTLNSAAGVLSGTPSGPGTSNFTVNAAYKTKSSSQAYSISVAPAGGIVLANGTRTWSDGTYAASCNDYRFPTGHTYSGQTGDGVYRLNVAGTVVDAYCDMTTDGGGWTMIVHGGAPGALTGADWNVGTSVNSASVADATNNAPASKFSDALLAAIPRVAGYRFDIYGGTGAGISRYVSAACSYQHTTAITAGSPCDFSYGTLAQAQGATSAGRYGGGGKRWHFGFSDDANQGGNSLYLAAGHRISASDNALWYTGNGNASAVTNASQGGRYRLWVK